MSTDYIQIAKQVIQTEYEALKQLSNELDDNFDKAVNIILKAKGKVIITGIGKSGHIGKKIAASFASTGTPSFFLHPSEAIHGDLGMIGNDDIVLAIANSGETPEILKIIPFTRENNIPLIAISSKPNSTLAQQSDVHLSIGKIVEACPLSLAPTTSSTLTLAMGDALMVALMNGRGFNELNFAKFHPGGSLGKRLLHTVANVMIAEKLPFIDEDATMQQTIYTINAGRCGVAIVGNKTHVKGIITDGDLRRAMESSQNDFFSLLAKDVMTSTPKFISSSTKLLEAKAILNHHKITSLLVGSPEHLEGIVQLHDLGV